MFDESDGLFSLSAVFGGDTILVCWSYGLGLWPVSSCCWADDRRVHFSAG